MTKRSPAAAGKWDMPNGLKRMLVEECFQASVDRDDTAYYGSKNLSSVLAEPGESLTGAKTISAG